MEKILIIKHIKKQQGMPCVSSSVTSDDDVITLIEMSDLDCFFGQRYHRIYVDKHWNESKYEKYIHSVLMPMLAMPGCDSEVRWI